MKKNILLIGIFLGFLTVISLSVFISCGGNFTDPFDITPIYEHQLDRSKWIGLSKFHLYFFPERGSGYDEIGFHPRESDWILARYMGFNIFRVAVDYQFIYSPTPGASTGTFDPHSHDHLGNPVSYFGYLDKMVEYGIMYGIVTNIDLHHAPGFTQADRIDGLQLWANSDGTLPTSNSGIPHFIAIWEEIARRYASVPDEYLHFNLVNEPPQGIFNGNSARAIANRKILSDTIKAIRAVPGNENRLIVLDCNQRYPFDIYQLDLPSHHELMLSPHCYFPWSFTHEGMNNTTAFPAGFAFKQSGLVWPIRNYFNGFLYGSDKNQSLFNKEYTTAVFNNPAGFAEGTVSLRVVHQSQANNVRIKIDGELLPDTLHVPIRTNLFSETFTFDGNPIVAGTKKVELLIPNGGDWLNIDRYTISGININCTNIDWGYLPGPSFTIGEEHWTDAEFIRNTMFPSPEWDQWVDEKRVRIGEMSSLTQTASGAIQRANLMADYVDAFQGMPMIFWEFKGGAMCIFNLDQNTIFTHPIEITFGEGQRQTYYYDKRWYDKIAHRLDLPENR